MAPDMDRFVSNQNIERYRKLASSATSADEKAKLLRLLDEEVANFTAMNRASAQGH